MNINLKIIFYFLGFLLIINGAFMFMSTLVSYYYDDGVTNDLLISGFVVCLFGLILLLLNKNHDKQINKREGYLIVVLGWIIMILSGTTPYFISESISGF